MCWPSIHIYVLVVLLLGECTCTLMPASLDICQYSWFVCMYVRVPDGGCRCCVGWLAIGFPHHSSKSPLSFFSFSRLRCCQPQKNLLCCCSNHLYSPRTEYSAHLLVFTVYIALSLCLIRISHAAYIMHKTVIHSMWGQTLLHAHVQCVNHEDWPILSGSRVKHD